LLPLDVSLDMRLSDLIGVDRQVEQLGRNTQQFSTACRPTALLWGSRGTGKSSLVRALLAEHAKAGLRLIEIERDHLADLPRVVEQSANCRSASCCFAMTCRSNPAKAITACSRACSTARSSRPGQRSAVRHVQPPPPGAGKGKRQRKLEARRRRAASQ
jgi:hypothetical protein